MFYFDILGNISSIVGLIITIFVLCSINKIKSYYIIPLRSPELRKQLEDYTSNLSSLLSDYVNNENEIMVKLARIKSKLNTFNNILTRRHNKSTKEILSLIKIFQNKKKKKQEQETECERVRAIYVELSGLIEDIKELEKDILYER